jgi:RNA polymerase sigma factor (sigma-70 family)
LNNENRLHTEPLLERHHDDNLEFSAEFQLIQEQSSIEQRQQLTDALSQLTTRQREAVYLKFYERLTYEEIAEMMSLTVKSTYKLIARSIEMLRKTMRLPNPPRRPSS